MTVYASWNGATRVKFWRVLSGQTSARLTPVVTARKRGFETPIAVPAGSYFAVQALAADGSGLGTSAAVRPS